MINPLIFQYFPRIFSESKSLSTAWTMEASRKKEPLALLSRNNAKTLLVRNAINQATLQKEAQLLRKERNSGERLFLKKKKHILQRQSRIISEMGHQRPLSSCSLQMENAVTRWNSETNLAGVLTPQPRRKEIDGNNKSRLASSSFSSSDFEGDDNESTPRPRRNTFSSLSRSNSVICLPDIRATSAGLTGEKKNIEKKRLWRPPNNGKTAEAVCALDEWKELRNCRYLRACSPE